MEESVERINVLVVEDNRRNEALMTILLRRYGFDFRVVRKGGDVLAAALDMLPALNIIFLDLELPDINGIDLFASLREEETLADTFIVAVTAHLHDVPRVREAGFDGFIGKPLRWERFKTQIENIIAGQPVWDIY